jgi:hypothetical protein
MSDNAGDRAVGKVVDSVAMEAIRQALLDTTYEIEKRGDVVNGIFANAHSFVKLSQGNDTVQNLVLYRYEDSHRDSKTLLVLGEGFVHLEAARTYDYL